MNLSTLPPASTNFCLPVKKGWHLEQISTLISPPFGLVERVRTVSPQAHLIVTSSYLGWIPSFTFNTSLRIKMLTISQLRYIISYKIDFCNTFLYFFLARGGFFSKKAENTAPKDFERREYPPCIFTFARFCDTISITKSAPEYSAGRTDPLFLRDPIVFI